MESDITHMGKYEIKRLLGKGAMGVVYEGFDTGIERRVAIKAIHKNLLEGDEGDALRQRFKREAQAAGKLMHQNIVAIYEYGEDQGVPFIAMEFIQGKELAHHRKEQIRFDISKIVDIMTQALDALGYVHRNGVIHRDIKPANIIILDNGQIKIADFGIARIDSSTMTHVGAVMGTPSYMSPEQFMGQRVDKRADLFAMGVILYELLTGEKPFPGSSMTTIMQKVLYASVDNPSSLNYHTPKAFDPLIQKALAKRPDDRFQNAGEFLVALRLAAENKPLPQNDGATLIANDATLINDDDATRIAYADDATQVAYADDATRVAYADDATRVRSQKPAKPDDTKRLHGSQTVTATAVDLSQSSPVTPTHEPTIPSKKRSYVLTGILIGLAIILAVVAFWLIKSPQPPAITPPPPPPPSTKSIKGIVSVVSEPSNAVILVNDEFMGVSPNRFPFKIGDHKLVLRKEGYYELSAGITVTEDKTLDINVSLDPVEPGK